MKGSKDKFGYSKEEVKLFRRLNTPAKIQDYLNFTPFNFEDGWGTCLSPRRAIRQNRADCIEGALLASAALEFHGYEPLVVDLRSLKKPYDYDHVIAVFRKDGFWGAISKTNHSVLRYREPIYKNMRELVMSYFHEYFLGSGQKTLREYSLPFNLNYFNKVNWRTSEKNLSEIMVHLDKIKHFKILNKSQEKNLRKADKIEIESTKMVEYQNEKIRRRK
ncbi:MAG TPA: hypothetical protein VGC58_00230 [Candidatus Paceibacterota bacterium]